MPGMPLSEVVQSCLANTGPIIQLQQPAPSFQAPALRKDARVSPPRGGHACECMCSPAVQLCLGGRGSPARPALAWQGAAALVCDVRGEFRAVLSGSEGP